ncbi:MAG: hypothetical protein ABWX92_17110 [Mycetocola sp.]
MPWTMTYGGQPHLTGLDLEMVDTFTQGVDRIFEEGRDPMWYELEVRRMDTRIEQHRFLITKGTQIAFMLED